MDYSSQEFISKIITILKAARNKLLYPKNIVVESKAQFNYVTNIDIKIQNYLTKELKELLPSSVVAEEGVNETTSEYEWIIDPIDGTTNYIRGFQYAISVALAKNNKTVLGFVYDILKNDLYYGIEGKGAFVFKNNKLKQLESLNNKKEYDDNIVIYGIPYDRSKSASIFKMAFDLSKVSSDVKRVGPAALDICSVATGKTDIYFEYDLQEWDYQASLLILKEVDGFFDRINNLFIFTTKNKYKVFKECVDKEDIL
jgi:myo-inositol-1(or 4)-monophosphatase